MAGLISIKMLAIFNDLFSDRDPEKLIFIYFLLKNPLSSIYKTGFGLVNQVLLSSQQVSPARQSMFRKS